MKNPSKNTYFKQLKNGRLKLPIKLYLCYRGRRDVRKKVIRKDEKGFYLSPFIWQEIHLYKLALQVEEGYFIDSILSAETESEVFQLRIGQKEEMIKKNEDNREDSVDKSKNLEQTVAILEAKKLEFSFLKNREEKVKQLRRCQLYSILQMKISTYWDGVLQVCGEDLNVSPITIIDHLIQGGEYIHEAE